MGNVIEIYGVAGSGKSTYIYNQKKYHPVKLALIIKSILFLWSMLVNWKSLIKLKFFTKSTKKTRILLFIYYKINVVKYIKKFKKGTYIYDQGPVYSYVRLCKNIGYEKEILKNEINEIRIVKKNTLSHTIFIKCDKKTCLKRVKIRKKDHPYKQMSITKALLDIELWETEFKKVARYLSSEISVSE